MELLKNLSGQWVDKIHHRKSLKQIILGMEQASLRNGNAHSADDWQSVLEPIIARYRLDLLAVHPKSRL